MNSRKLYLSPKAVKICALFTQLLRDFMSSNDQQTINLGMSKYDLIWQLACAVSNRKEDKDKPFLETYALCHTLVNAIDSKNTTAVASLDLGRLLEDYLKAGDVRDKFE
jgi:hypothetical protein